MPTVCQAVFSLHQVTTLLQPASWEWQDDNVQANQYTDIREWQCCRDSKQAGVVSVLAQWGQACHSLLPQKAARRPGQQAWGSYLRNLNSTWEAARRFGEETGIQNTTRLVLFPIFLPLVSPGPGSATAWNPELHGRQNHLPKKPSIAGPRHGKQPQQSECRKPCLFVCFPSFLPSPQAV